MHVVATAGHVDHGKSTLVRALTGTDPDRLAEEKRRGLTIDLGFAWTTLPPDESAQDESAQGESAQGEPAPGESGPDADRVVAFVDVPGHERFLGTMLAGLGPSPAVLFVVAADEGWREQSGEHLAAVDALGLRSGLLVITRADLADPTAALAQAQAELAGTSLARVSSVAVSAVTGEGMGDLARALTRLVDSLPPARTDGPVRLWVDRSFSIRGAGTVVTGTLPQGRLTVGDELLLGERRVRIRGLQALGEEHHSVPAVARVAVNLRGVEVAEVTRGDVLLSPGDWWLTDELDVGLDGPGQGTQPRTLPGELLAHLGTAAVEGRPRPLGDDGPVLRLTLRRPLPVRAGDRLVLRDPGLRTILGARVLDPDPPALRRRGSARQRGAELLDELGAADGAVLGFQVRRRGAVRVGDLRLRGFPVDDVPVDLHRTGDWLVASDWWSGAGDRLRALLAEAARTDPLDPRVPTDVARRVLTPAPELLSELVSATGLAIEDGRVVDPREAGQLGPAEQGLRQLHEHLDRNPFAAPDREQLLGWGLGARELAAAERLGRIVRLTPEIVLLPRGPALAMRRLAGLPQPFTAADARTALQTTRRVVIPLLEYLNRRGWTGRVGTQHHQVRPPSTGP